MAGQTQTSQISGSWSGQTDIYAEVKAADLGAIYNFYEYLGQGQIWPTSSFKVTSNFFICIILPLSKGRHFFGFSLPWCHVTFC